MIDGTERADTKFLSDGVRANRVGVDNGGQMDRLTLLFQFVIHAGVIASESAYAYDGYINAGSLVQRIAPKVLNNESRLSQFVWKLGIGRALWSSFRDS